jgi:two-component system OmpR family response regulator
VQPLPICSGIRASSIEPIPNILVVDDDPTLREVLRYTLEKAGFTVSLAVDGADALRKFDSTVHHLLVLDVTMPQMNGFEVCKAIRETSQTAILFLSSRGEVRDRVEGLDIGGDDYLTKPFSPQELVSRVRAILRRHTDAIPEAKSIESGSIRLDAKVHRVWVCDDELTFTATEFGMLHALMTNIGDVYSRERLVNHAYGENHFVSDRTVDSHIRRVRQKFRVHGLDPIETVHGVGFRFREEK